MEIASPVEVMMVPAEVLVTLEAELVDELEDEDVT